MCWDYKNDRGCELAVGVGQHLALQDSPWRMVAEWLENNMTRARHRVFTTTLYYIAARVVMYVYSKNF
jgi:hypothetical protein